MSAQVEPFGGCLRPVGGTSWAQIRQEFHDGWSWIWTDLTGLVLAAELPATAPITTRLWGWQPGAWARLVLDRPPRGAVRIVGALLTIEAGVSGDEVEIEPSQVPSWLSSSSTGRSADELRSKDVRCLDVPTRNLTFVELVDKDAP